MQKLCILEKQSLLEGGRGRLKSLSKKTILYGEARGHLPSRVELQFFDTESTTKKKPRTRAKILETKSQPGDEEICEIEKRVDQSLEIEEKKTPSLMEHEEGRVQSPHFVDIEDELVERFSPFLDRVVETISVDVEKVPSTKENVLHVEMEFCNPPPIHIGDEKLSQKGEELEKLEAKIIELKLWLQGNEEKITQQQEEIEAHAAIINKRDEEIIELKKQMEQKRKVIEQLQYQIQQWNQESKQHIVDLSEKDKNIQGLKNNFMQMFNAFEEEAYN